MWSRRFSLALVLGIALSLGIHNGVAAEIKPLTARLASSRYMCRSWQIEKGSPFPSVRALVFSRSGRLIIGTQEDVATFDGDQFKILTDAPIRKGYNPTLHSPLLESRDGSLWFSDGANGLVRLKDKNYTRFGDAEGLKLGFVRCVMEDRNGILWAGGKGMAQFDGQRFKKVPEKPGIPSNAIHALYEDRSGTVWVGTTGGLLELREGKITFARTPRTNWIVEAIFEDTSGNLWVGSDCGIGIWDGTNFTYFNTTNGLSHNTVRCFYEDVLGNVWVGTQNGLNRFEKQHFVTRIFAQGVEKDFIFDIEGDAEGDIWLASSSGLYSLKPRRFRFLDSANGLPQNATTAVLQDDLDRIWVGTLSGLACISSNQVTSFQPSDGLANAAVWSICQRKDRSIWIGTGGGGINQFVDGKFRSYRMTNGLPEMGVKAIYEDRTGLLWLGGSTSLTVFDGDRFQPYLPLSGISFKSVNMITEDQNGVVWIATGDGLFRAGASPKKFSSTDGLTCSIVNCIYADSQGTLWIGTEGGGLNWFRDGTFFQCGVEQGLETERIYGILEDDGGHLWFGSHEGIVRVEKERLWQATTNSTTHVGAVLFDSSDGMVASQCNGLKQPSCWKTRTGSLWFSTVRGMAVVSPAEIEINRRPPPVLIENVMVNENGVGISNFTRLSPGVHDIDFQFTALSYTAPEKVFFKVKLHGFDTDWEENGTRRTRHYTNLRAGEYRFQVIACNNDGVWNTAGASFSFVVAPFWYETGWFYLCCGLIVVSSGMGLHRARVHRMAVRERELIETVDERSRHARELQQEIHERKQAEAALRQSEELFSKAFRSCPTAMTLSTLREGRYADANESACELFGYSREEIIGRTSLDLGVWSSPQARAELIDEVIEKKSVRNFNTRVGNRTLGLREVLISAEIVDISGTEYILVNLFDMTELKRAEQDRIIMSKLESTGILAGGIAHDFNNLLTAITLNLDLAQSAVDSRQDPTVRIETARKATTTAQGLAKQLITFAKGGAPIRKPSSLVELIHESVSVALSGSSTQIEVSLAPDLAWAELDEGQIRQVLHNLLLNAREAMPNGGSVIVRAANVTVLAGEVLGLQPGTYIRVSITDTGGGIPVEVLPKIFDPYFSTKQRGSQKGMGLGLTICHSIINKHGGVITVDSKLGIGSTFRFYLPALPKAVALDPKPQTLKPAPPVRPNRILVMDDDELMRFALRSTIEKLGHRVETANDGQSAINLYAEAKSGESPFDIAILDLTVRGGMGGQEAVAELRKIDPEVKAIVISGYSDHPVLRDPAAYGFVAGMEKSFDVEQLRDVLSRVLAAG